MSRNLFLLFLLFFSLASKGQSTAFPGTANLSDGARLLFKNVKTKTLDAEKNFLFQKAGLALAPDKKSFVLADFPVDVTVYPTDLNKDGKEEIFIVLGSTALYGNTGVDFLLFLKNKGGSFEQQKEIGGGSPVIFANKNLGYNDIMIGLPGMEFPVYRWNGTKYTWYKKVKNAALNTIKAMDIEAVSKEYTSKL